MAGAIVKPSQSELDNAVSPTISVIQSDDGVSFISAQSKMGTDLMTAMIQMSKLKEPQLLYTPVAGIMMVRGLMECSSVPKTSKSETSTKKKDLETETIMQERLYVVMCNQTPNLLGMHCGPTPWRALIFNAFYPLDLMYNEDRSKFGPVMVIQGTDKVVGPYDWREFDTSTLSLTDGQVARWQDLGYKRAPMIMKSRLVVDPNTMDMLGMAGYFKRAPQAFSMSIFTERDNCFVNYHVLRSKNPRLAPHLLGAISMSVPLDNAVEYFQSLHKNGDKLAKEMSGDMLKCIHTYPAVGPYTSTPVDDKLVMMVSLNKPPESTQQEKMDSEQKAEQVVVSSEPSTTPEMSTKDGNDAPLS